LKYGNILRDKCRVYGLNVDIRISDAEGYARLIGQYDENPNVICYIVDKLERNHLEKMTVKPVLVYSTEISSNSVIMSILKLCGLIDNRFTGIIRRIFNDRKNCTRIEDLIQIYKEKPVKDEKYVGKIPNHFKFVKAGKIRDIYSVREDVLALFATNKISSFDRILGEIPYKGAVLNKISKWWFKECSFVPNHIMDIQNYDSRMLFVKKCKVFPIEFVMRGYMTGSTDTSIWKNYEKGVRMFCGHILREGYLKNERLDEILLTPTTKSDEHDKNLSEKDIISEGIMTKEDWDTCKKYAYELFRHGQSVAAEKGMILVDTKYEFGKDKDGKICLVDELHTPDSSRYWIKYNYEERFKRGLDPDQISKEFVRQWVRENVKNPYDSGEKIILPREIVDKCSNVYKCLDEIICS
jgi:phosphoribosylaminoimidazole-succinocarboxamide synthase